MSDESHCALLHEALVVRMSANFEDIAKNAVKQTLLVIGIDVDDPLTAQRDFAVMREIGLMARDPEFRKDLEAIRAWRKRIEAIGSKSLMVVIGAATLAGLGWAWSGFKNALH